MQQMPSFGRQNAFRMQPVGTTQTIRQPADSAVQARHGAAGRDGSGARTSTQDWASVEAEVLTRTRDIPERLMTLKVQ